MGDYFGIVILRIHSGTAALNPKTLIADALGFLFLVDFLTPQGLEVPWFTDEC